MVPALGSSTFSSQGPAVLVALELLARAYTAALAAVKSQYGPTVHVDGRAKTHHLVQPNPSVSCENPGSEQQNAFLPLAH